MDDQHRYEINMKKDGLFINLSSDDVYFISKQMDKWFRILLDDSYVPVTLPVRDIPPDVVAEAEALPPVVESPVAVAPVPVVAEAPPAPPPPAPATVPMPEPVVARPEPVAAPISEPPPLPPVPEQPILPPSKLDAAVEDDFEAVMDSLMRDLEDVEPEPAPPPPPVAAAPPPAVVEAPLPIPTPPPPVSPLPPLPPLPEQPPLSAGPPQVASLAELCERSQAGNSEDYLLLSAYYLTRFEHAPKFSLKRVNSLLVKSGLTPVNHSVLEAALSRGYLSMVPDLTGSADVSEYNLSAEGEQVVARLI